MEQPEDLGRTKRANLQFHAILEVATVSTAVFSQLDFGSKAVKPLITLHPAMRLGPPQLSPEGDYLGPLEPRRGQPLIGHVNGKFKTAAAAAWPAPLCQWVAQDIIARFLQKRGGRVGGGTGKKRIGTEEGEQPEKKPKPEQEVQQVKDQILSTRRRGPKLLSTMEGG